MASLFKRGDAWSIQFDDADGRRRTIGLGRLQAAAARTVVAHVEHLAGASASRSAPPPETSRWLASIGDVLHDKLADVGLTARRASATLKTFAEAYVESRKDWSDAARVQFNLGVANAVTFFGADRRLNTVTAADADAFRATLAARLAPATVRKRMRFVKHLFRQAVRGRALAENPFADQKTANVTDRERLRFVDGDTSMRVADELRGDDRLVFVLARFAGLRTPSETYALRWADVDFAGESLRVFASKTKRSRTIPLLPVVRDALLTAFGSATDGAEFVFEHRRPLPVLRRAVERAIVRAGVTAWPKTFQQLRASFATDCVRVLPANAAALILGHSAHVAAQHYWTADATDVASAANALRNITESSGKALPAHASKSSEVLNGAALCGTSRNSSMGGKGLEPLTFSV